MGIRAQGMVSADGRLTVQDVETIDVPLSTGFALSVGSGSAPTLDRTWVDENGVLTSGPDVGYSAESLALFARFTTAPTNTRKGQIDTLIRALKTGGIWAKLDALYVMAAADSQAARRNWIADQYNMTAVASPTFTADRGYQGDGTSSYLSTGFNASTAGGKLSTNSATLFTYANTDVASNAVDGGATNASNIIFVNGRRALGEADAEIVNGSTGALRTAVASSVGLTMGTRTGASATALYRNATQLKTATTAATALPNGTISLCGSNTAASYSTRRIAVGGIGSGLDSTEAAALYNALNTYLTAVGAA